MGKIGGSEVAQKTKKILENSHRIHYLNHLHGKDHQSFWPLRLGSLSEPRKVAAETL